MVVECGAFHTCVVTEDGSLYTWGRGRNGALGLGSYSDQYMPQRVPYAGHIMGVSAGMGHSVMVDSHGQTYSAGTNDEGQLGTYTRSAEPSFTQITSIKGKIKQVSCGLSHTLLLTSAGIVFGCGQNNTGQLGLGHKRSVRTPAEVSDISHIPMGKIAAGSFSASVSSDTGELYIWGSGPFGEFITPHRVKTLAGPAKEVSIGHNFGIALT